MKTLKSQKMNDDLPKSIFPITTEPIQSKPALSSKIFPATMFQNQKLQKYSREMHADKPQSFLLKGKKERPQTAKPKKPEELKVTEVQDNAADLYKILHFYRERVQAHEQDRHQYLSKLEKLRIKQDQGHKIQWELQKRIEERKCLEEAVRQCQDMLGSERNIVEEMSAGAEELVSKQNQNKKVILNLLEKSNSVEQHVYYQAGESPEKIQQYYLNAQGEGVIGGKQTTAPFTKPIIKPIESQYKHVSPKKPNILRTIYMPNFEVDQGREQVQKLRDEIDSDKIYYEDILKCLQEEKAQFEEQYRAKYMLINSEYENLLKELHDKEKYNQAIVKDHIELKHIFEIEERAQQEENEALRQQNLSLRNAIRRMCNETKETVNNAKNEYENNSEEFSIRFREQSKFHDINMSIIRDQYNKVQKLHQSKTSALNERLSKEESRFEQLSQKRNLELEGSSSDLQNLEKRMIFYQNYIGKLKKLVDKDQIGNFDHGRGFEDAEAKFGMDQENVIREEKIEE